MRMVNLLVYLLSCVPLLFAFPIKHTGKSHIFQNGDGPLPVNYDVISFTAGGLPSKTPIYQQPDLDDFKPLDIATSTVGDCVPWVERGYLTGCRCVFFGGEPRCSFNYSD